MTSRRAFLQQASVVAAAGIFPHFQLRQLWGLSPHECLPEPDEALMRELALAAMDAARAAGADFADIRLAIARAVSVGCGYTRGSPRVGEPSLTLSAGYGVRAIVDGAWGFAGERELTTDAVAATARAAVAGARVNRPRRSRTLELAPTPRVANGVWATPMGRDPLTVSLGEQAELMLAALAEVGSKPAIASARLNVAWRRPTAVFATTDGTLLLQRLATAQPVGRIDARVGEDIWSEASTAVEGLQVGTYGYEAIQRANLRVEVRRAAERAVALARAARSPKPADVGRYDLVLGPEAVAALLVDLAGAVSLPRTLGYSANGAGTSFAAPPADILGQYQVASERVTVHADRSQPGGAATVGWDQEGVKPEDYTFVQDGVIVDYHTDRQTAMELADWYRAHDKPVRAHGCTRRTGPYLPVVGIPNLTLAPGPGHTTLDDLIADTRRGLYIESAQSRSDQQVLNAQGGAPHTAVRRITNGKLGDYVRDCAFQFVTPAFWKRVDGLGGVATMMSVPTSTDSFAQLNPLQPFPMSTMRTVPVRVRQVNVLNVGRTA